MAARFCSSRDLSRAGFSISCIASGASLPTAFLPASRAVMLLEASAVTKQFGGFRAVSDASISVGEGEIVGLIGPNGAGKSTMFNCLGGDLPPTSGRIIYDGRDVTRASPETHARLGIGRTFQVPVTFEDMSILENVMVGAFLRHPERNAARDKARQVLDEVGLGAQTEARARS